MKSDSIPSIFHIFEDSNRENETIAEAEKSNSSNYDSRNCGAIQEFQNIENEKNGTSNASNGDRGVESAENDENEQNKNDSVESSDKIDSNSKNSNKTKRKTRSLKYCVIKTCKYFNGTHEDIHMYRYFLDFSYNLRSFKLSKQFKLGSNFHTF